MKDKTASTDCPCGSGNSLAECCGPFLDGIVTAPSAEVLMRSRYTAYTLGDESYLLNTWHRTTRPVRLDFDPSIRWMRLNIQNSAHDRVAFVATYKTQGKAYKLQENSRFIYEDHQWFYVDDIQVID